MAAVTTVGTSVVVHVPGVGWSTRVHARAVAVTVVVLALAFGVFCWSLSVGDFPIALSDVLSSLVGAGHPDTDFVVRTLRLPRGLTALLVGAGFGLSGAIFQRLTRNPLASPDIIGVNAGAAAAGVLAIVVWHAQPGDVTLTALAGGLVSAVAIYVLAYKQGVTGYRLVLVGIGITAMLGSVTSYLLTRAEIFDAQRATVWLTGSLNGRSWDHVRPMAWALAVLLPVAAGLARQLRLLELGDDAARGLGSRVEAARGALLLTGVGLAAIATASAGPIGFVALVSPQIARRLVGPQSVGLLPAAACGALLLVASDLVGRRIFAPTELPVGIVTAVLGAPYLLFLLARANKIGSGG
ncbi:MAG TPA: iron chelate uptake ABC transporter family permease subunit [Acidimicrobiales bacterium]|nr:iron chelate uptake ABC transporter family permease subunit [Acidimicrobiales bacterium]